ncbi:MAG: type II toxin-antitoxin system RelE/ParE family toxin [Gammaproteobacteria bacterium]|nr:type II toxin-antitoxin system RelE/ParE family toxin [Gammaproteobacteria bacterium]
MRIRILRSAGQDLIEGYRFYERQASGVGAYFLDALYSDLDSLAINAGVHAVHFDGYHRLLSKRFPFAVYYRIEHDEVRVYAVLDCRRQPAWIRSKLPKGFEE